MDHTFHVLFDDFEFESGLGVFHESGVKINLKPKELAVLEVFLRSDGKLVSKDHLIDTAWKGSGASDGSIARSISVIKSTLRDANPEADTLIKNEYGRGYRFTGSVTHFKKPELKEIGKQKRLSNICSRDILNCNIHTSVRDAANLLSINRKSSIIINDNGNFVGIWTEADALALDLTDPKVFDTKISQVMHSPVITVEEWKPLSDAVFLMRKKGIRHLLVTNKLGNACGVISQTDLVQNHGVESFLTVKDVKSVAFQSPLVISQDIQVSEVAIRMRSKHTEIAIIQLADQDMFSFTERDLVKLIANDFTDWRVSELVSKPLITVKEEMTLLAARQLMEIEQIRHLAVLNTEGALIKVLALSDILKVIEYSYVRLLEEILEENKQTISAKEDHIQMLTNAVQQTAGMILICNKLGEVEYVNQAFESISGYTLDEIKGQNPRFLRSGLNPPNTYENLWKALLAGQTWKGELCNQNKAGGTYWVIASITPIYNETGKLNHYVAVEEDITERIEMEKKLREFEQHTEDVTKSSPIMFWESNMDGKFIYFSHYWFEFTGRELRDLYGNGWARQIHPDDLADYLDSFQKAIIERCPYTIDIRLKNAEGEYRWLLNNAEPHIDKNSHFTGFRGYCIDITERKMREMATTVSLPDEA